MWGGAISHWHEDVYLSSSQCMFLFVCACVRAYAHVCLMDWSCLLDSCSCASSVLETLVLSKSDVSQCCSVMSAFTGINQFTHACTHAPTNAFTDTSTTDRDNVYWQSNCVVSNQVSGRNHPAKCPGQTSSSYNWLVSTSLWKIKKKKLQIQTCQCKKLLPDTDLDTWW